MVSGPMEDYLLGSSRDSWSVHDAIAWQITRRLVFGSDAIRSMYAPHLIVGAGTKRFTLLDS